MNERIYIAQLNSIVGDIEYNKNRAISCIKDAIKSKVDLIIFPSLFLIGNPYGDILLKFPHLLEQSKKAIDEIAKISKNISVLIGFVQADKNAYYDSICYINNGIIEKIIRNTYKNAEFNIKNRIIELKNKKYGILASEDNKDEIIRAINREADILIDLSADLSRTNMAEKRHNELKNIAKKYKTKLIYVNQIGANDEKVFEGASRAYNENGEITSLAKIFEEDILNVDFNFKDQIKLPIWYNKGLKKDFSLDYENDLERTYRAIVYSIKEYFSKNGLQRAVLGLSGGLDSSVCAVLLAEALGINNVLGISMPSKITSSDSKNDAKKLANNLKINFLEIPIKDIQDLLINKFENMFNKIDWCERYKTSYTKDNIQARSRATILWGVSNEYPKTIPIATSDKSETYMGYATINGDMSGGFAPILDVSKTKLFALAKWINKNYKIKNVIPKSVIEKPPGAELAINPKTGKTLTAEEALMPYEFLDEAIWRIENFNQTIQDMIEDEFLYEKKNSLTKKQKLAWLEKFFKRMSSALYKLYISAPGPIVDIHSINKAECKLPITSNIKY